MLPRLLPLLSAIAVGFAHHAWQVLFLNQVAVVLATKSTNPLKVFILAGQSNMVGTGSIEHLNQLVRQENEECPCCNEYRTQLWNGSGYKSKDNVYIRFGEAHGRLTVDENSGYAIRGRFGPEVMIGWTIGDAFNGSTILLIKTAWGEKSLGVDFRPPSSGLGNHPEILPERYGWLYRQMIHEVKQTLSNLTAYVPTYRIEQGYELSGFVWHQGNGDCNSHQLAAEYGFNLVNLVRDVRKEFKVDRLSVVVAELGHDGTVLKPKNTSTYVSETKKTSYYDNLIAVRTAQYEFTQMDEFRDSSLFVRTAPYAVSTGPWFDGAYHFWGRADTHFLIGKALGLAALQLLEVSPPEYGCPQHKEIKHWQQFKTAQYQCEAVAYCANITRSSYCWSAK